MIQSLEDAWKWYKAVKTLALDMRHLAGIWDEPALETVLSSDNRLRDRTAAELKDAANTILGTDDEDLNDLTVLVLFSVFEATVRARAKSDVDRETALTRIVPEEEGLMRLRLVVTTPWGRRLALFLLFVGTAGCGGGAPLPAEDPSRMTLRLTSAAFQDGGMIPKTYSCDGADRSPPLEWSGVPGSARSLALICDDPDAPGGTWSHWVVFNMPPEARVLGEGIGPEEVLKIEGDLSARQGKNDFGRIGYGGPCPPRGTHHYFFRLYALDTMLDSGASVTRSTVLRAIEGHIVAEGRLMGTYSR